MKPEYPLVVDIGDAGAPSRAYDLTDRLWTRVSKTSLGASEPPRCLRCRKEVRSGWRLGTRGRTAYCDKCVDLNPFSEGSYRGETEPAEP